MFDVRFMVITLHFYLELNVGIRNIFEILKNIMKLDNNFFMYYRSNVDLKSFQDHVGVYALKHFFISPLVYEARTPLGPLVTF